MVFCGLEKQTGPLYATVIMMVHGGVLHGGGVSWLFHGSKTTVHHEWWFQKVMVNIGVNIHNRNDFISVVVGSAGPQLGLQATPRGSSPVGEPEKDSIDGNCGAVPLDLKRQLREFCWKNGF